ncbi:hypothetical protein Q3G72_029861 [Acer saccharum]|nr:hypothetical protein Q3G72_029861 [Acer saccharum]
MSGPIGRSNMISSSSLSFFNLSFSFRRTGLQLRLLSPSSSAPSAQSDPSLYEFPSPSAFVFCSFYSSKEKKKNKGKGISSFQNWNDLVELVSNTLFNLHLSTDELLRFSLVLIL